MPKASKTIFSTFTLVLFLSTMLFSPTQAQTVQAASHWECDILPVCHGWLLPCGG